MSTYDLNWLQKNATSISDRQKKLESFEKIYLDEREDGATIYYLDQQGQYRYETVKK